MATGRKIGVQKRMGYTHFFTCSLFSNHQDCSVEVAHYAPSSASEENRTTVLLFKSMLNSSTDIDSEPQYEFL